jgi:hypothetical protein
LLDDAGIQARITGSNTAPNAGSAERGASPEIFFQLGFVVKRGTDSSQVVGITLDFEVGFGEIPQICHVGNEVDRFYRNFLKTFSME